MKPARLPARIRTDGRRRLRIAATGALIAVLLAGCEQNTYVAPPPPRTVFARERDQVAE